MMGHGNVIRQVKQTDRKGRSRKSSVKGIHESFSSSASEDHVAGGTERTSLLMWWFKGNSK
jgi:hypothetical protein